MSFADDNTSMAEYEYQYGLCNEGPDDECDPPALQMAQDYWRTRDGKVLEIKKMSATHIANAVAFFERHGWGEYGKILELRHELERRKTDLKRRR